MYLNMVTWVYFQSGPIGYQQNNIKSKDIKKKMKTLLFFFPRSSEKSDDATSCWKCELNIQNIPNVS